MVLVDKGIRMLFDCRGRTLWCCKDIMTAYEEGGPHKMLNQQVAWSSRTMRNKLSSLWTTMFLLCHNGLIGSSQYQTEKEGTWVEKDHDCNTCWMAKKLTEVYYKALSPEEVLGMFIKICLGVAAFCKFLWYLSEICSISCGWLGLTSELCWSSLNMYVCESSYFVWPVVGRATSYILVLHTMQMQTYSQDQMIS